ncbi:TetR/AcrR family transcriptional regulator [Flagellatimonas centrodinii]|uniref:TetR/AcrR family transcriptional regulator n=1 Tax=Flagellatimonas centrodinii TaxID=2806210 RepID=UPI001FEEEA70|nr:TetR/AcrR family transcriptional regulator [Flagellatimonas centrodinii]ULQ45807.1 TetR/AcrR family transcriptional regulator [Flagellatimonas centrodinii]
MPRKPAREQGDTLNIIHEQAFQLFGRYGYEGVSIGDIAKQAKLSKGALYWHFQGKDALFLSCLRRVHDIFNEHIFLPMAQESRPGLGILRLFEGLEDLMKDPRIRDGVAGYWLLPASPEATPILHAQRTFEAAAVETVRATLERGQQNGVISLGVEIDDMSRAIISLVEAIILPMRHQAPDEVRRTLGVLVRTLFRAYAAPESLALLDRFARP